MSGFRLTEGAAPPTPPTGKIAVYAKSDGLLYSMDDQGVESAFNPSSLLANGTVALVANWDVGAFEITLLRLHSDEPTLSPFTVVSNAVVDNLNADLLDGSEASAFATSAQGTLADSAMQQADLDAAVAGLYDHKGGYDADTNTPDLDTSPSGIKKGDAYTVSVAGTFYAVALEAGDVLIADQDDPTASTDWTIVNRNIDSSAFATAAQGTLADSALQEDGSTPLTADWDVGTFDVRAESTHQDGGAATAVVVNRLGATPSEGYEVKVIDETLSGLSAISTDLTQDVPQGAVILCVQANIETTVVAGGTSVKVGIGPTSDPDKYGITTDLTQNQKIDTIPAHVVLGGADDIQVNMCTSGGAIGDTVASAGAVRVRIVYAITNSLDDA